MVLEDIPPRIASVLAAAGDVSDEVDYAVNNFVMTERGLGLTACQPSLVQLEDGGQAIRFKLDSTFIDNETNKIMGYGKIGTEEGFAGEVYLSFNPEDPDDMHPLYITPQSLIDTAVQQILSNPEQFPPTERPRGKY